MSKKDKKRIKNLERGFANLTRMHCNLRDNYILNSIEQDKREAFQSGTVPHKKQQEQTEQNKPPTTETEQELLAKLNAELAKFSSLEAFNADRKNFFLPPIDKLKFDQMKASFDFALAGAKLLRPEWYDQIDQIKMPEEKQGKSEQKEKGHGETEQTQPENVRENLGEPVLNKPAQFKKGQRNRISPEEREENIAKEDWESRAQISAEQLAASLSKLASLPLKSEQELKDGKRENQISTTLKMLVDDLTKHLNFALENWGQDRPKQVEMLQRYCDHFKEDLSDFRRKTFNFSELIKAEESEAEQDSPTLSELEQGKVWIIQTNPKQESRLDAFYIESLDENLVIYHTPEPQKAMRFNTFMEAQIKIANTISCARGWYKSDNFKVVPMEIEPSETEQNEAEQSGAKLVNPYMCSGEAAIRNSMQKIKEAKESEEKQDQTTDGKVEKADWFYVIQANYKQGEAPLYVSKFYCLNAVWDGNKMNPIAASYKIETTSNKAEALRCSNIEIARREIENMKLHGAHRNCDFGTCELQPVLIYADKDGAELGKPDGSDLYKPDSKDLGGADGADSSTKQVWVIKTNEEFVKSTLPDYVQSYNRTSVFYTNSVHFAMSYDSQELAQNAINEMVEFGRGGTNYFLPTRIK